MANIRWQRLILRGFGCYRDEFTIELDNKSVLALPNEAGKSTLVAGLAAVLFGLPNISDPTKFGQARYRNWHDAPEFSGELYFAVDKQNYHLVRKFATHEVTLRRHDGQQWVQVPQATGTDNPSASRPFRGYRELLQQLLGVSSLDLFLATFCLSQPLPEPEGLDAAVQGLLAGAGGSKATAVQQLLESEIKDITRYYGEPLGRARGGNKDRQLEELQDAIANCERQIESGRESADELQLTQARLAALTEERQAKQHLLTTRSATLQAWSEWRTQAERYQHGLEQQQQVEQALYRARQLEEQAEALESQLATYTLFTQGSVEWEQFLEQQLERERDLARLQREQTALQAELTQLKAHEEQTLNNYEQRKQKLAAAVDQAQERYAALVTEEATGSELEQDYHRRFGDLQLTPAELLAAIKQRMQGQVRGRRRQKPAASGAGLIWASRLGGMLLAAISYVFWGQTAGPLGLAVSLACCLLGWLLPLLGGKHSSLAPSPVNLALKRCQDLQATQTFLESLLAAQATRPTSAALAAAQAQLAKAQAELASCQGMIAAYSKRETGGRSNAENRLAAQQIQIEALTGQLSAAAARIAALGEAIPADWVALRQQYQAYRRLEQSLNEIRQAQAALWSAQQVAGLASLARRALDLQNTLAATRLAWQTLVDKNPGLPSLGGESAMHPQEQFERLKAETAELQQAIADLQREEEALLRRRAQLEGQEPVNIAVAQECLQELRHQEERHSLEVNALGLAYRQLEAARIDYSANHRERLAAQVSHYFGQITGQPERRVELDADFAVSLRGSADQVISPAQLSQGARDQLYLSLRLAIADLLSEDICLPLILDDPFVNCDGERLERIRQALAAVAKERQIWLLTHNPQFVDWGSC